MFNKKLDDLSTLLKQFKASIKMPKMEGVKPIKASVPKLPGLPQASKKDPVMVAQQIENADVKPIAIKAAKQKKESLQISKSGQWSMANHQEDADGSMEKSNPMRSYKFKPAATADGHSSYHAYHDGNHVGTLSVNHKDNSVSGQVHGQHEGNRDFLHHAVKAFHIAKRTNTDN